MDINLLMFGPYIEELAIKGLSELLQQYNMAYGVNKNRIYIELLREIYVNLSGITLVQNMQNIAKDYSYFDRLYRLLVCEYLQSINQPPTSNEEQGTAKERLLADTYLSLIKLFLEELKVYGKNGCLENKVSINHHDKNRFY